MADGDREVLSSLPHTRPERRSAKRGARTAAGAAEPEAAAKARAARARPRAKPKAAARAKPRSAAGAKPRSAAGAAPKAVRERKIPRAGYAVPKQGSPVHAGGTELVGTAIQAVGELANLGTRTLRDVLGRLPRP